jgi:IS5 family transposase
MHQTKKGTEQHCGMKAHLGVDSETKVIHALRTTPANVADSAVLGDLLQGRRNQGLRRSSSSKIKKQSSQQAVIKAKAPRA